MDVGLLQQRIAMSLFGRLSFGAPLKRGLSLDRQWQIGRCFIRSAFIRFCDKSN